MKVLIGCEFSGVVREAFRLKGHDAWSCDLLPTEIPGQHIQDNVLNHLDEGWDLAIFHPPCTHLAASGARWFKDKIQEQADALEFVQKLLTAPIDKIALENPISIISSKIRKPDQIVQPYWFGDPHSKRTCLWLKNLPLLKPTNPVEPEFTVFKSGKKLPTWYDNAKRRNKELTSYLRSKTFQGMADAMADQWG